MATAKQPTQKGGRQYHIACRRGDLAGYVLLPGDPGRVEKVGKNWDDYKTIANHREYHSITGHYKSTKISCLSTGIGSPSAVIALEEAARIGVHTFIRIGSTGALQKEIKPGDFVINFAALRKEGTSKQYIWSEYPAVASYEVTLALIEACEKLKVRYHLGVGVSADSFYVGEGRPGFKGYWQSKFKYILNDLAQAKITNVEMEASALFTVANLYNLRAGAICVVFDNLITDEFKIVGEKKLGLIASEAVDILHKWDIIKKKKKKKYFYPTLIK
ncbi:nucleoside phosphorylase [bacterium]|nr:nucleoside phosphorylase [bacterium]